MPHRPGRSTPAVVTVLAIAAALVLAACSRGGGGNGASSSSTTSNDGGFVAQVASYELVAGAPAGQRFMGALAGNGNGKIVSFGTADLQFFYLGTKDQPVDPPQRRMAAKATFLPVAGQHVDPATAAGAPKVVDPSAGIGVYAAEGVKFDTAGYWGVTITAKLAAGGTATANAPFEVYAQPRIPFPGQPAPRSANPVAGAAGVDPHSIDSRASAGQPIPDANLHSTSIADALAAGKPVMVVVSTPVYCVSRFCGPVTDAVGHLATIYGDRMAFVHLEVWKDFDKKIVNDAAAEWIEPKDGLGDTQEPWVFVVGRDGLVKQRFDNVANDADLEAAVKAVI
jgi:hypothetical protein